MGGRVVTGTCGEDDDDDFGFGEPDDGKTLAYGVIGAFVVIAVVVIASFWLSMPGGH